jgi:multiple sugar transport system substrate-binding protein
MTNTGQVDKLAQQFIGGELSRRDFVKGLALLGLSMGTASAVLAACQGSASSSSGAAAAAASIAAAGAAADERAVNLGKAAVAGQDVTLTVMYPSGALPNLQDPFAAQWTQATGIKLKFVEAAMNDVFQKAMQEAVTKTSTFDLYVVQAISICDLAEAGLIADLTDLVAKYNPEISSGTCAIAPGLDKVGKYKGRDYGFSDDCDVFQLYLRTDLLEDTKNQADFKAKYGIDLQPPNTLDEYNKQTEFFTGRDAGLFGGTVFRSVGYGHWSYLPLLAMNGRMPFDDNMHPQLSTPEGIAALQMLVDTTTFQAPDMATFGWAEQYAAFGQGKGYSAYSWPSFFKFNNDPKASSVVGKFTNYPAPGTTLKGKTVTASQLAVAWNWTVSNYSKNLLASYAYAQWMNSPAISTKVVAQPGVFDAFRLCHFTDPTVENAYGGGSQFMDIMRMSIEHAIPDIVLRGGGEYTDALSRNLNAACYTGMSIEQALKDTETAWEKTTDRLGRDIQSTAWKALKATYPPDVLAVAT